MRVDVALQKARAAGLDRADAEILLAHCCGRSRAWLFAYPEHVLDAELTQRYSACVQQRSTGVPVAYLLGQQEFYGLPLAVSPAVLVPRPETELLVEFALQQAGASESKKVLDLGTGSGAIALAIASQRPDWSVCATDRSAAALQQAKANAQALGLGQVRFAQGDWLQAVPGEQFDLILSNPPYLAADDPHLPSLRHEPLGALVAGEDALTDLRQLVNSAWAHLHAGGWLALEHGCAQASEVCDALRDRGYVDVGSQADLAGHARISFGRRSSSA